MEIYLKPTIKTNVSPRGNFTVDKSATNFFLNVLFTVAETGEWGKLGMFPSLNKSNMKQK